MKIFNAHACSVLLLSAAVQPFAVAAPTVTEGTITWSAGDWHQVQRSDDFTTVCEGAFSASSSHSGGPCAPGTGRYIVINHATGERFEDFQVTDTTTTAETISVEGNTISWPDNGWYQVQETQTYKTICEGGTSCTVTPGQYTVINHTTTQRFEGIVVGETQVSPSPATVISVEDNTITWSDEGWYQVQNATTFESLCDGGSACQVAPGRYMVINHTTAKRTLVTVPADSPEAAVPNSIRANFSITVPAYQSNALQVQFAWGDTEWQATWVVDETWSAAVDLPANSENRLIVTFNDRNGDLTLGSFETTYATGIQAPETLTIQASDFNLSRWDTDGDGQSNLSELMAGTDPLSVTTPAPVQAMPEAFVAALHVMPTKTFRVSWEPSNNATYYQLLENQTGASGYVPVSNKLPVGELSYDYRVALFKSLNARYIVEACNALGCISSNELTVAGSLNNGIGIITTSDPDEFIGREIAISADGQTLAFANYRPTPTDAENIFPYTGAVHVYTLNAGVWQPQAIVEPNNGDIGDSFGSAISLSRDGTVLAVGADGESSAASGINGDELDNSLNGSGAAYIFTLENDNWQQEAYIKTSEPDRFVFFGRRLDLSADGKTLAVIAPFNPTGVVYVFARTDSGWQQQAQIGSEHGSLTGSFVSLSENGNTLATGAIPKIFSRRDGIWQLDAVFEREEIGALRGFGSHGTLSDDGMTLVISANQDTSRATGINPSDQDRFVNATLPSAGGVHVFALVNGNWAQQAYIKPSVAESYTSFGDGLSISSDGNTLAIYSRENTAGTGIFNDYTAKADVVSDSSPERTGSVYLYQRSVGIWRQEAYVKPAQNLYRFWGAPALDGTGDTMVIQGLDNNGAVYIY